MVNQNCIYQNINMMQVNSPRNFKGNGFNSNLLIPHSSNAIMFEDYYPNGEIPDAMVNIEDPSAFEQESNVCGLEIVGKHWSPQSW